jgi:hypothetical protein
MWYHGKLEGGARALRSDAIELIQIWNKEFIVDDAVEQRAELSFSRLAWRSLPFRLAHSPCRQFVIR